MKKYLQQNDDCDCQICTIGSASLHADPSVFLLEVKKKDGRPRLPKQTKLTDFFPQGKNDTQKEIATSILENVSKDSVHQFVSLALDKMDADSEGNTSLKRYHGPPKKVGINKVKPCKTVISHKTLFRIKSVCNESGNQITKIARILNKNSDVKIEPNFQDALYEQGHLAEDFFQSEILEMEVYEEQDLTLWSFTKEGNLVDKVGQLPFKDKIFNVPDEGKKGHIEEISTKKVLSPKSGNSEIVLNKKKTPKKVTRSSKKIPSDDQIWLRGPSDSYGWFKITHVKSGKFLTSSTPDKVTAEELEKYLQS